MKNQEALIDVLTDLRKRGYEVDFSSDSFCLYCSDLDLRQNPDAYKVDEIYRFKEDASHDDNSTLYAISLFNGVKGTWMDSNGSGLQF